MAKGSDGGNSGTGVYNKQFHNERLLCVEQDFAEPCFEFGNNSALRVLLEIVIAGIYDVSSDYFPCVYGNSKWIIAVIKCLKNIGTAIIHNFDFYYMQSEVLLTDVNPVVRNDELRERFFNV